MPVAIKSPHENDHHSHPLIHYNMPVIPPGEKLDAKKPKFKIPQPLIDILNKPQKRRRRHRRAKPKKRHYKKLSKPKRKILGYHRVCLKWIIGVLVNRHFNNKHSWKFKDAIFDEDGKYRYCKKWGKLPIYEDKKAKKGGFISAEELAKNIEALCTNQLRIILNLNQSQRKYWRDKIKKQCEVEKLKELVKKYRLARHEDKPKKKSRLLI